MKRATKMPRRTESWIRTLGNGALAGLAGTVVMTLAQKLEMKVTQREPSTAPADALEKVTPIALRDETQRMRVANAVHFAYGTAWGEVRGVLSLLGLHAIPATLAHLGLVWGTALRMLPALDLAPPVRQWGAKAIAKDLMLHAVYVAATAGVFEALQRRHAPS
jgi:hypothetical protein